MAWMVAVADRQRDLLSGKFECYSPKYRERIVRRGRRIWRDQYLFGRYFFVFFTAAWRDLFSARGVAGVITVPDTTAPATVADEIVAEIKSREVNGYVPVAPPPEFRRGQKVQIKSGLMMGRVGIFDGMSRKDREIALLDMMGKRVRIAAGSLRAVQAE